MPEFFEFDDGKFTINLSNDVERVYGDDIRPNEFMVPSYTAQINFESEELSDYLKSMNSTSYWTVTWSQNGGPLLPDPGWERPRSFRSLLRHMRQVIRYEYDRQANPGRLLPTELKVTIPNVRFQ